MLDIRYKNGRGHLQLDLDVLLPCSASDFRRLTWFVDLSDDIDGNAKSVYDYIVDCVHQLQQDREALNADSSCDRVFANKVTSMIKKYLTCAGILSKSYGLPVLTDNNATMQATTAAKTEEVNTMTTYTANTASFGGRTYPAEYNVSSYGTVLVFLIIGTLKDGRRQKERLLITSEDPDYQEALAAAKAHLVANGKAFPSPAPVVTVSAPAAPIAAAPEATAPVASADVQTACDPAPVASAPASVPTVKNSGNRTDPKQARGPVPEKTFIGKTIKGNGWKILFDGDASRTRIMFDGDPTDAAKAAVEDAGFYYSRNMSSWNKKLTFKAYRAAQALSARLAELYAA